MPTTIIEALEALEGAGRRRVLQLSQVRPPDAGAQPGGLGEAKITDKWDYFDVKATLPENPADFDKVFGTQEEIGCKMELAWPRDTGSERRRRCWTSSCRNDPSAACAGRLCYVLIAIGLSIIFGLLGIVNFAHGAFFTLGAYFALTLSQLFGWPAVILAPIIVGGIGMVAERLLIQPALRQGAADQPDRHLRPRAADRGHRSA